MLDVLLKLNLLRQLVHVPIHAHTHVSALLGPVEYLDMFPFPAAHYRGKKLYPGSLRKCKNLIHDLVYCLPLNLPAAIRTMRNTDPCIQQPEVIINLCHCPHRGTWIPVRGFLVNRNSRRQSLNPLYIRLLHLSQELPCIRRQRLHVSSLAFRIDRIKREGGLTRTGQSCEYHEFVSRNIYIDCL